MSNRVYILDAGHGGINPSTGSYVTGGKRSPLWTDGTIYYEGVGNRQIVALVIAKLQSLGIENEVTVLPENYEDVGLSARCKIANVIHTIGGKRGVLISVHSNAAESSSAHGFEVFTSPGQTASDGFAKIWLEEHSKAFPELRNRGHKEENFTVLTKSNCPAILIETMFHTNENECRILMSEAGRCRIADAIVSAILRIEKS
jgi:N-acetylmuramoyl-L-alanine amidase